LNVHNLRDGDTTTTTTIIIIIIIIINNNYECHNDAIVED